MVLNASRPDKPALTACGGEIEDPERFPSAVFRGERVFFCAQSCLKSFESDPEGFMAGEIEHPVDED